MSALVCLYYPHNLIPALTAMRDHRTREGISDDAPITIFIWLPGAVGAARREAVLEATSHLTNEFPVSGIRMPDLGGADANLGQGSSLADRVAALRLVLPGNFRELYFAHDVLGDQNVQIAMRAFPGATRICYGDSLGTVYTPRHVRGYTRSPVRRVLAWMTERDPPGHLDAEIASLLLPADPGGDFLPGKILRVPEAATAREVIQQMAAGWPALGAYVDDLLSGRPQPHLLLLGNLVEASLCSEAGELSLYEAVVSRNVPAGEPLILKPHPGQDPARVARLVEALQQRWRVTVFDQRFIFAPIEVAGPLVRASIVLSSSYSTLSLRYLYGMQVRHVLDDALIDAYVLPEKRRWMKEGNRLYMDMLRALDSWDGKSVLTARS